MHYKLSVSKSSQTPCPRKLPKSSPSSHFTYGNPNCNARIWGGNDVFSPLPSQIHHEKNKNKSMVQSKTWQKKTRGSLLEKKKVGMLLRNELPQPSDANSPEIG